VVSSQVAPWAARGRDTITRACGDQEADLDWGVATLATLAYALREYAEEGNDRPLAAAQEALRVESRVLSAAGAPSGPPRQRQHSRDGIAALPIVTRSATTSLPRALCAATS